MKDKRSYRFGPSYFFPVSFHILLLWIREFLEKCNIDGSYMEFGVFNGESMKSAYYGLNGAVTKYIGFDSFCGLPELVADDLKALELTPHFTKGNYASQGIDFVKNNILSSGIDPQYLSLIEGFFDETLTSELQLKLLGGEERENYASVIHLDVDLYSSTLLALNFAYKFMQTGCWLLCDDYWTYGGSSIHGTQKALNEFLEMHKDIRLKEYCSYGGWAKAFIIEKVKITI